LRRRLSGTSRAGPGTRRRCGATRSSVSVPV
jgi:hypothetical protein